MATAVIFKFTNRHIFGGKVLYHRTVLSHTAVWHVTTRQPRPTKCKLQDVVVCRLQKYTVSTKMRLSRLSQ